MAGQDPTMDPGARREGGDDVPSGRSSLVADLEARRVENSVRERLFGTRRPPIELERYRIIDRVGAGASGVVYAAYDRRLDRKVALKVLRSRLGEGEQEVQTEGRSLARLAHPNVVTVHDVGVVHDQVYVAMEYIAGRTLREWLAEDPDRSWRTVLAKVLDAGRGLAAVHRAGLVHRDFKPDNILVDDDGWVRIVDFGLARASGDLLSGELVDPRATLDPARMLATNAGEIAGTPAYMAPEQLRGRADASSDQFAFCVTAWEALFRNRPFRGESLEELAEAMRAGTPAPSRAPRGLPGRVRRALLRGMRVRQEERFPTMDALLGELESAVRRRPRVAGALAVAAAGSVAMLVAYRAGDAGSVEPAPCAAPRRSTAEVWGPADRAKLDALVASPTGHGLLDRLGEALEGRAQAWEDVDLRACRATFIEGRVPEAVYASRALCLDRRLLELEAFARSLVDEVRRRGDDAYGALERGYDALGALPRAERCLRLSSLGGLGPEAPERSAGSETARLAASLEAELARVLVLQEWGEVRRARAGAGEAYETAAAAGLDELRLEAAQLAGELALDLGELDLAEERLHEAARFGLGRGDLHRTTEAWLDLALIEVRRSDLAHARRLGEYADALARQVDPEGPLLAKVFAFRGWLFGYGGAFDRARELQERALAMRRDTLEADHVDIGRSLVGLAGLWLDFGHPEVARARFEEAVDFFDARGTPLHQVALEARIGLGVSALRAGDANDALAIFDALAPNVATRWGSEADFLGQIRERRGQALLALGRGEEAVPVLEGAVATEERTGGESSPSLQLARIHLGEALHAVGEDARAEQLLRTAARRVAELLGEEDLYYGHAAQALGDLLRDEGRHGEAADWYRRARRALTGWRQKDDWSLGLLRLREAQAAAAAGDVDRSRREAAEARRILAADGTHPELLAEARALR